MFMFFTAYAVLAFLLRKSECASWDATTFDKKVWANNSGPAELKWRYQLDSSDSFNNIYCGYTKSDGNLQHFIEKNGLNGAVNRVSSQGVQSSIEVITDTSDPKLIGFRITRVNKKDPMRYTCQLIYTKQLRTTVINHILNLEVLDRPQFIDCLKNLERQDPVKELNSLDITCKVLGNPVPKLQCKLYSFLGKELAVMPETMTKANISGRSFSAVTKVADYVTCFASAEKTGEVNYTQKVIVQHTPFKPKSLEFYTASDSTITIRWIDIPQNETGTSMYGYKIFYQITQMPLNKTTKELRGAVAKDGYIYYTITDLVKDEEYRIQVWGFNRYGRGDVSQVIIRAKPLIAERSSASANIGAIIGGVIGGLAFIIIFVVLVVWCSKTSNQNKRYPTSYVDDVIDYPAVEGLTLYAGVEKKPRAISRSDSTSGYPDVVTNGNDQSDISMSNRKASYEQSESTFI